MFQKHFLCREPEDRQSIIWRYLDLAKYMHLLETASLHFTRADRLGDPFEGSYSRPTIDVRQYDWDPWECSQIEEANRAWPRYVGVSCWQMSQEESAEMWRLYIQGDNGVAIRSTYERLIDALRKSEDDVFIGTVSYLDYDRDSMDEGNPLLPVLHKRHSFEHERELRAMVLRLPDMTNGHHDFTQQIIGSGILVPVAINALIEGIVVAPDAPKWFTELVGSISRRYGVTAEVTASRLAEKPVY